MKKFLLLISVGFVVDTILLSMRTPLNAFAATAGSVSYSYDSLGRITQETYSANSAALAYDNAGNRTATTQN